MFYDPNQCGSTGVTSTARAATSCIDYARLDRTVNAVTVTSLLEAE